ncbi:winged helix-turn-helix transcriptional regulator [Streptomyces lunaelactis]|uniref:winged helix-turn-helix transcriptional regulator n=1 Tax=Streptomyces lunaelactis TaxID=1535768 RepID=UPI00158497F1|nr:helix-turn-helix domain-containing protein [Streptomyces lunaelactis]NUK01474.1 helix-turn-helix transcriptional regulator [Streptomyces lunaelactis]NUK17069.1 helix-turn-helix transcriptional regulator [Streptomyces lunaelactis]
MKARTTWDGTLPALPLDSRGRPCSVAASLQAVGEKWALLAVREISFGNHRFGAIARNTGAPRDVLTVRLRHLETIGVLVRRQYSEHPPRFEYHLTEAGRDLLVVLTTLRAWGDRWLVDEPPAVFTHSCGEELDMVHSCRHCGREVVSDDLRLRVSSPGWDAHGPV